MESELARALRKIEMLKQLMLLTHPCVSNVVVGETQLKQWAAFIAEFDEERGE